MVVVKTEEEIKYRHKYFNGKMETENCTNSKPDICQYSNSSFIYRQVLNIVVSVTISFLQNDSS